MFAVFGGDMAIYLGLRLWARLRRWAHLPLWVRVLVYRDESHFSAEEAASNFVRFFRSKHVLDLRRICYFAIGLFVLHVCLMLYLEHMSQAVRLPTGAGATDGSQPAPSADTSVGSYLTALMPLLAPFIPVYATIIAWAYLNAGKRLGVVDLFACEIGTLCRVGTLFDIGPRYVQMHELGVAPAINDDSKENYFPIFDNNSNDLQALEALVVNKITEFYTYMKAERDVLRRLAKMEAPRALSTELPHRNPDLDSWRATFTNVIYLTFLGYESARKAIEDLVEFQPTQAENTIVILLTEIPCYSFLSGQFLPQNLRSIRLALRLNDYKKEIPELYRKVDAHGKDEKDWIQAKNSLTALANHYKDAFGEDMSDAIARLKREEAASKKAA